MARSPTSVFVVGAGRLGSALARGLADAGWEVSAWTRTPRRPRHMQGITLRSGEPPEEIASAKLVLVTVPDRAIGAMAARLAELGRLHRGQVVAHCSGSLDLSPLEPAREAGASVGSLHPLVAAAPGRVDLAGKAGAIDGDPAAARLLRRVARAVGLRPIEIPSSGRVRYHAAASLAANGLVSLADLAVELLEDLGLRRDDALAALLPLLHSSLEGLARAGLPGALTGPVARGDAAVVERHLKELAGSPALEAYRVLSRRALGIAAEQGGADPEGLKRIRVLLSARR